MIDEAGAESATTAKAAMAAIAEVNFIVGIVQWWN